MKTSTRPLVIAMALALVVVALALPREATAKTATNSTTHVIGLSPFLEKNVKDEVYRRIIALVVEDLPLGSTLRIYDAYNLQTVTDISVPNLAPFRSAKTRANQFSPQILKLRKFLGTEHTLPEATNLSFTDAVHLPQFLDFLNDALTGRAATEPLRVMVLGSPLYLDPKEPVFSMNDGYYPSDGHLKVGRERSVYGVSDRSNALTGLRLDYGYFGDPWVSGLYEEKVARFWHLFLRLQGAELATFSGDLATVFNNFTLAGSPPTRLASVQLDPGEAKLEMLRVSRDVDSRDWIARDDVAIARNAPSKTAGPMKIGIRWQGDWDLDLYATARPGAETLFFQHTRCPEGYYYKDHRSSPGREYEFIEFTSPVNVWEVEAMVNFYRGQADEGASGEVRIEFENKIYSGRFRIPASEGNRGRYDDTQQEFWTKIDVPALMHLDGTNGSLASRRNAAAR